MKPLSLLNALLLVVISIVGMLKANAQPLHDLSISNLNEARSQISKDAKAPLQTKLNLITVNQQYNFTLTENAGLLSAKLKSTLQPNIELYKGVLDNAPGSWARFSVLNGIITGAFFDGSEMYFVVQKNQIDADVGQLNMLNNQSGNLVVYSASDVSHSGTCGLENHASHSAFSFDAYIEQLNEMTSELASKEMLLSLTADVEYATTSAVDPADEMLAELNIVDGIFSEQVGVKISVNEIRILTDNGPLTSTDSEELIVAYRNYVTNSYNNPGASHLFTGKDLDGGTIGIAYVGAICNEFAIGLTQRFGANTALVTAHELGHNFGAPHDNQSGSACVATPGIYLMNPSINGSDQFSDCSLSQMAPLVNSGACLVSVDAPVIVSTPNTNAVYGAPYSYDSDGKVEATGSGQGSINLDFGPEGMTVGSDALVSWTPTESQLGTHAVQITVSTIYGSDTQNFDITVTEPLSFFNFTGVNGSAYGNNQDGEGQVGLGANNQGVVLQGNRWIKVPFNYEIQSDTVLEFDFISLDEGEIHGIGFDDDNNEEPGRTFQVHGTENWGITASEYSQPGQLQRFVIPIGEFYTGTVNYMFFVMDNDATNPVSNSGFKDILLYNSSSSNSENVSTSNKVENFKIDLSPEFTKKTQTADETH